MYAPAWQQPQGRRSSRGILGRHHGLCTTLAGALRYSRPIPARSGDTSGGGLLLNRPAESNRTAASRAGDEPPNLSSHSGLSRPVQVTHRPGPWRGLQAWAVPGVLHSRVVVHHCSGWVWAAQVPGPAVRPAGAGLSRGHDRPARQTRPARRQPGCLAGQVPVLPPRLHTMVRLLLEAGCGS